MNVAKLCILPLLMFITIRACPNEPYCMACDAMPSGNICTLCSDAVLNPLTGACTTDFTQIDNCARTSEWVKMTFAGTATSGSIFLPMEPAMSVRL